MAPQVADFLKLQRAGKSRDKILAAMKKQGLTMVEAIKVSMQLFHIGLEDAKSVVASHPSWRQTHEAAKPLHDALIEAFQGPDSPGA